MALGRLTSFTFGTRFLTLVYDNSQTFYVSYAHLIGFESDPRSGDLTIWLYTAGEVSETLSVKNSDLVAIGSSAAAFVVLMNQNIQPYSYWQDFLDSATASGALPSEPSALRGQCLYGRFRPLYNSGSPSLINVPARFKAGTLYSQVPDTGAGDFTVSRTTTVANRSTRINKDGLIELVNDNVPRLDYPLGGAVNGCPALLVEPSAQNLALQSEAIGTSPWGTNNATVTANAISSPDNNLTADQINYTANTASRVFQTIASSNSTTYTYSVFIKNNTFLTGELALLRFENNLAAPNDFEIRAVIDPTNIGAATFSLIGTAGTGTSGTVSGSVQDYGNGWWRVRVTGTTGTAAASATANIRIQQSSSVIARSIYAWGAQLETGSVATSYIPTTTAAITRAADVISKTAISSLIGQTEGTIYWEGQPLISAENDIICINRNATNSLALYKTGTNLLNARVYANGVIALTIADTVSRTGFLKLAVAYKSGDTTFYVNGTKIGTTNTNAFTFTAALSTIEFNGNAFFFGRGDQRCRAVAIYPNRLSDAQLATLTTP